MLVGNKTDNSMNRQVSYEEAQEFASDNRFELVECSVKDDQNIMDVIQVWNLNWVSQ